MKRIPRLALRAALGLAASSSAPALASPWSLFGFTPRAKGMAGAHTALSEDFAGVHYNPGSLTEIGASGFGFTGAWTVPDLEIRFDRPESAARALEPRDAPGIAFGAQFLIGEATKGGRVGLGLGIHVPTGSLLSGQALDPETPHWYVHQSLPQRIVAALGLGWAPWDWLSIGGSIQILAGLRGRLDYELDIVAGRFVQKSVVFDIEPKSAPSLGIEVRPMEGLRLGATWRSSIDAEVDLPVDLEVTGLATLLVTTEFRFQYMPAELALGASYRLPGLGTSLAADVVFSRWSTAPDPSPQSAIDAGGGLLEGTGLDDAFDAPAPGQSRALELGFRDVWSLAVGAEQPLGPAWIRAGYALHPTPAPRQTSGANHVDGTRHVFALGGGIRFDDPLGVLESPLVVDASLAASWLPDRRHEKIGADDPIGSYTAGGRIWSLGLGFRYVFDAAPVDAGAPTRRGSGTAASSRIFFSDRS